MTADIALVLLLLALLLQATLDVARRCGILPVKVFMPMAFAYTVIVSRSYN